MQIDIVEIFLTYLGKIWIFRLGECNVEPLCPKSNKEPIRENLSKKLIR